MTDVLRASPGDAAQRSRFPAEAAPARSYGFAPALVAALDPLGPHAEAIRTLRTHVVAQHLNLGRRALAVCAPDDGQGCTFVAANLAVALSQMGVKTILIDGNLRDPGVDRYVRPSSPVEGLCECLTDTTSGSAILADLIQTDILPDLSIMYAGRVGGSPQELLAGDRFKTLMSHCLREYEMTIIDTPPANTSSDARRISSLVGYGVIVAIQDKTFMKDVEVLVSQLRLDRASVLGVVFIQS
jgi:capsular exopolysaccharide synthesis family protein